MKRFTLILFSLAFFAVTGYAQEPDTVVVNEGLIEGVPAWIEAALALIITLIPGSLLVKVNYRLGKFAALSKALTDALSDNRVDNNEIIILRQALKDLVAKQES